MNRVFCTLLGVVVLAAVPTAVGATPALDAALNCRKFASKATGYYANKRRTLLGNCIDKLVKCEVQSEIDNINPSGCRSTAKNSCKNTIGSQAGSALSIAGAKFEDLVNVNCAAVDFNTGMLSNMNGGLWYSNDADCGASADLATSATCLRQRLGSQVDEQVGQAKPRGGILLDNIGLGADFPDLLRPPTVDVLVQRDMAGMGGTLLSPGTIMIASGTAVRFSGDPTTLACNGMGNNARVTITILTSTAMDCNDTTKTVQVFQIKEPFTATNTATTGPFTTDMRYCLEFREGGNACTSNVDLELIDVP